MCAAIHSRRENTTTGTQPRKPAPLRRNRPGDRRAAPCLVTVDDEGIVVLDDFAADLLADGRPAAPAPGHADDCPGCGGLGAPGGHEDGAGSGSEDDYGALG